MTSGLPRQSGRLTSLLTSGLGWKCRCGPSVGGELWPEISLGSPAVSAVDNPVWIPASRAACWDDYHNETARSVKLARVIRATSC